MLLIISFIIVNEVDHLIFVTVYFELDLAATEDPVFKADSIVSVSNPAPLSFMAGPKITVAIIVEEDLSVIRPMDKRMAVVMMEEIFGPDLPASFTDPS